MRQNLLSRYLMAIVAALFVAALTGSAFAQDSTKAVEKPMHMKGDKMTGSKGLLDGKHFIGEIGKEGATTGDKESISFRHGTFHSSACDPMGFTPAAYTAKAEEGGVVKFTATCTSPTSGKMEWNGTVKGETLEATATNVQEGKDPAKMWAKASLEKAEMKMKMKKTGTK
jgi:hypothetical protein